MRSLMKVGRYARCAFSTLVLPQHILTNPLHAPRRQSPLAALFALDTCFVDESEIARQPTSPFPLYSPPNVHGDTTRFRALSLPYFIHLSIASLSITLRIVAQGMRVVSPSRSGIVSGGRYVLLHKQRIIEVDLCCMLVVCSCMAYPLPVGSPVSHQTYQYIHILAHLPVRMRLHDLLDSTTGVQSWRHGWVWSALQESFVFGCQVVRAMGCSR